MWQRAFRDHFKMLLAQMEDNLMSTNTPNEKGTPQSRTYTVNDIAAILGIGRATAYKLANSGAFKTIRIGNMIVTVKAEGGWTDMGQYGSRISPLGK